MNAHEAMTRRRRQGLLGLAILGSLSALAAGSGPSAPARRPAMATRPSSFERAIIVPIDDEITDITLDSVERRLKRVHEEQVELVIVELDTPGGALGATLDICKAIKKLRDSGVRVYAWINDEAYSAGTIIALATDGIVMARNATIGDCQPIMFTGTGVSAIPEDIEAKATSPLLAELEDSARRNGYNYDLVLAFVRPEIQVFWVVNIETDEKRFVDVRGRDELFGLDAPAVEEKEQEEGGKKSGKRRDSRQEPVPDSQSRTAWKYVRTAPGLGDVRQPIESDLELLTMRDDKAAALGFSLATLSTDSDLKSYFGVTGPLERAESTWLESLAQWLASPLVRGVLFLLMVLGAYAEFQTPGFGLPGAVALVALVLFLGAPYLAGYTVTWEIVVIVAGALLLAVEVFVTPGFGVAGITGIILLMVGLLGSFVPQEPSFGKEWFRMPTLPVTYKYFERGMLSLAGGLVGAVVGMVLLAKYLPRIPVAGRIIAPNPSPEQVRVDDPYDGAAQVGDLGRSESSLRPAGKARFGATLVDVVAEGDYIEKGTRIEVIQRQGSRVVVRRVD